MDCQEILMTTSDVAERLKITAGTVRKLVRRGDLGCYRVGRAGDMRFSQQQLEEYLTKVRKDSDG